MPKFEKIKINGEKKVADAIVFIPEDAAINNNQQARMLPPLTEYENRRCSVGRKAIRQITGK